MAWGRALYTPCPFWIRFLAAEFLSKISKTFSEAKIDTLPSSLSLIKNALCGSKEGYFSCFHRSCQLGLKYCKNLSMYYLISKQVFFPTEQYYQLSRNVLMMWSALKQFLLKKRIIWKWDMENTAWIIPKLDISWMNLMSTLT